MTTSYSVFELVWFCGMGCWTVAAYYMIRLVHARWRGLPEPTHTYRRRLVMAVGAYIALSAFGVILGQFL